MSDLKPCPFCGGEATKGLSEKGIHIYCSCCNSTTKLYSTWKLALDAWNKRDNEYHSLSEKRRIELNKGR